MKYCDKCGAHTYGILDEYVCPCKEFKIIDEDGEEHEVRAKTAEDAALKYAEDSNWRGDYYLMNESVDILVDGKAFKISAEPDVHYSAVAHNKE